MDPVVGSVMSSLDMIGSNSNSAGCGLINLCSLCNLQFSENNENIEADDSASQEGARVEKLLDIFLSDNDEHDQVQLCLSCKMLCTNLDCTKQSLLFIINKITTLLLQNSRFTLVNPTYKIISKLFQFRHTKGSPTEISPTQTTLRPRTLFENSKSSFSTSPIAGNILNSVELNQAQRSLSFAELYLGDKNISPNGSIKSIDSQQLVNAVSPAEGSGKQLPGSMLFQAGNCVNTVSPSCSELIQLVSADPSLHTPPFPSNYEMSSTSAQKDDELLLSQLESFNFPLDPGLVENMQIAGNENAQTRSNGYDSTKASSQYICEVCGKSYLHRKRLEVHVRRHDGEPKFQCSICQKTFTQKCGLQRQLPLHTGELPFQCTQCDKKFKHHSSLNVHKLMHEGKKEFSCRSCDISFISTSHLRRHQKSHTGFKPFSCHICPRTFSEKYNLDSHVRTHTGETAYKCSHCPLGFNRKKKLKHHVTLEHATL